MKSVLQRTRAESPVDSRADPTNHLSYESKLPEIINQIHTRLIDEEECASNVVTPASQGQQKQEHAGESAASRVSVPLEIDEEEEQEYLYNVFLGHQGSAEAPSALANPVEVQEQRCAGVP